MTIHSTDTVHWEDIADASPDWARGRQALVCYRGSESHGTSIFVGENATDDVDVLSVTVQRARWYEGFGGYRNEERQKDDTAGGHVDLLTHDVRKFFWLLAKGNPNMQVALWLRPEHYLIVTDPMKKVIARREVFLSRRVIQSLGGYAADQFAMMTEQQEYKGYMGAKRKAMVNRYGYDVKNAAHCVRLLHMGIELCADGRLSSWRPYAERLELMEIKRGEWPLDHVKARVADLTEDFRAVQGRSTLPDHPDMDQISELLVDLIHESDPAVRASW